MKTLKVMLMTVLIFVAISIVRATSDYPPCATQYDSNGPTPGSAKTLKGCTNACDGLCPSGAEHTKCYQGCNANYS
jgi:hypothetical protein